MAERTPARAPRGTEDVMAPDTARWQHLLLEVAGVSGRAGYARLRSPLVETADLVRHVVGDEAIVEVRAPGSDERLALTPGVAASAARAFAQHGPATPWKVWSLQTCLALADDGPPVQRNEVALQALGSTDPDLDVEVITVAVDLLAALGLARPTLVLNSLGTLSDRRRYVEALRAWLADRRDELPDADRRLAATSPLKVLASTDPDTRSLLAGAPRSLDGLSDDGRAHLEKVQEGVGAAGIDYLLDHRVAGGSPHAVQVVFELQADDDTVLVSGGRHEGMVEDLGGPATPGVGWRSVIESLLDAGAAAEAGHPGDEVDVFVVDLTGGSVARDLTRVLRRQGVRADRAFDDRSMRAQMKAADRSGAAVAVIVGEQEQAQGVVALRRLRGDGEGDQTTVPADDVVPAVRAALAPPREV
ncbi:MAG TPA: HisS family protein [Iamia sp.]